MAFDVLIVDDSPAMRRFIRRVIGFSGFDVGRYVEAADGKDALNQLDRHWVDAILTDINMPVMDGEAFVRELRRRSHLNSVPVIVISTDATDARMSRLSELGAQGYVTKPFSPERLRAELEMVLGVAAGAGTGGTAEGAEQDELCF